MTSLKYQNLIYERLKRQRLLNPISSIKNEKEYIDLFKLLQPVAPVHFTRPGDPPKLVHRTSFDDFRLANKLRKEHTIIKGRFSGGRVSYVLQEDLKQYAVAFRKPLSKVKPIHEEIMAIINHSGGMSKDQLKQELNYASRDITQALKILQESFFVYEDQTDTDWDTGWFDFKTEWFDLGEEPSLKNEAVAAVILNFLKAMVFATLPQMKSWSQINLRILKQVIQTLLNEKKIVEANITGLGAGYMRSEDDINYGHQNIPQSTFMMDKSDFLVRAYMTELQDQFKGYEVLQYLLIDGEFKGAVLGHWRIGPYDIDDIILDLDNVEAQSRKEEILKAVRKVYAPERTAILRYNGKKV